MKPGEKSRDPQVAFYPLERDRDSGCTVAKTTGEMYDGRYADLGLKASLGQMYYEAGVMNHLRGLPMYSDYVGGRGERANMNSFVTGYGRSAIAWDLKCEATKGTDRASVYAMLTEGSYEDNMGHTRSLIWVSAVLIFLAVFVGVIGLLTFCKQNSSGVCNTVSYLIGASLSVFMAILLVVWAPKAVNEKLDQ